MQTKETICSNCGRSIRALGVDLDKKKLFYCEQLKCKVLTLEKEGVDWRPYFAPKEWEQAQEVLDNRGR